MFIILSLSVPNVFKTTIEPRIRVNKISKRLGPAQFFIKENFRDFLRAKRTGEKSGM